MAARGCSRMLLRNPDLVALVARVLGTAPPLADTLAQHPQVLDALVDPAFFGALPGAGRTVLRLVAHARPGAFLRGVPRPRPHVRPGAGLSDRRAHTVRHRLGAAGRVLPSPRLRTPSCAPSTAKSSRACGQAMGRAGRQCRRARHGQTRRPRNDCDLRPRPHRGLRFRCRPGVRRRAPALCQSVLCPIHSTPDQRVDHSDQLRPALSRRYAVAAVRTLRPGGDLARRVRGLSTRRGMDLGTHGADAGAGGLGAA